jgi:hypothetical protein
LFKVCKCGRIEELSQHINGGEKPKMQTPFNPQENKAIKGEIKCSWKRILNDKTRYHWEFKNTNLIWQAKIKQGKKSLVRPQFITKIRMPTNQAN